MTKTEKIAAGALGAGVIVLGAWAFWPKSAAATTATTPSTAGGGGSSGGGGQTQPGGGGGNRPPPAQGQTQGGQTAGGRVVVGTVPIVPKISGGGTTPGSGPPGSKLVNGGGVIVHGAPGQQSQPYTPSAVVMTWPQAIDLSITQGPNQAADMVYLHTTDSFQVLFEDPTSVPGCVPNPSSKPGFNVACNHWEVTYLDTSGVEWTGFGGKMPLYQSPGEPDPTTQLRTFGAITFSAVSVGAGTLIFRRKDDSGNVSVTFQVPFLVTTP